MFIRPNPCHQILVQRSTSLLQNHGNKRNRKGENKIKGERKKTFFQTQIQIHRQTHSFILLVFIARRWLVVGERQHFGLADGSFVYSILLCFTCNVFQFLRIVGVIRLGFIILLACPVVIQVIGESDQSFLLLLLFYSSPSFLATIKLFRWTASIKPSSILNSAKASSHS